MYLCYSIIFSFFCSFLFSFSFNGGGYNGLYWNMAPKSAIKTYYCAYTGEMLTVGAASRNCDSPNKRIGVGIWSGGKSYQGLARFSLFFGAFSGLLLAFDWQKPVAICVGAVTFIMVAVIVPSGVVNNGAWGISSFLIFFAELFLLVKVVFSVAEESKDFCITGTRFIAVIWRFLASWNKILLFSSVVALIINVSSEKNDQLCYGYSQIGGCSRCAKLSGYFEYFDENKEFDSYGENNLSGTVTLALSILQWLCLFNGLALAGAIKLSWPLQSYYMRWTLFPIMYLLGFVLFTLLVNGGNWGTCSYIGVCAGVVQLFVVFLSAFPVWEVSDSVAVNDDANEVQLPESISNVASLLNSTRLKEMVASYITDEGESDGSFLTGESSLAELLVDIERSVAKIKEMKGCPDITEFSISDAAREKAKLDKQIKESEAQILQIENFINTSKATAEQFDLQCHCIALRDLHRDVLRSCEQPVFL